MNVLIIDDSKAMQNIITKSMKNVGYVNDNYSYAGDGEEALGVIRSSAPDLVLCDMHMPKMTGLELLKKLRSENNATRIIIVSIDDDPKTVESVRALGGDAYLKKPFTSEQLFNTITTLLGKTLTKKAKTDRDVRELLPNFSVIERILSSFAASDVKLTEARFDEIDYGRSPYYGGTFQDDQNHIALGIFLDGAAANTVAAIIARKPLKAALDAIQAGQLDTDTKQVLFIFLGLFAALCRPSPAGNLLEIHAEQFAADARTHLSNYLAQYSETAAVYSINCGPCQGGKIIFICP
jgi:two-component system chemotaxis response regulator CheY